MDDYCYVGIRYPKDGCLREFCQNAKTEGFEFVGANLFPPQKSPPLSCDAVDSVLPTVSAEIVHPKKGHSLDGVIAGFSSDWIDCDSDDPAVSSVSQHALKRELSWAIHLSLPAFVVTLPKTNIIKTAQVLATFFKSQMSSIKIWIAVPMDEETRKSELSECDAEHVKEMLSSAPSRTPWHLWSQLVALVGMATSENLGLLLSMPVDLPDAAVVNRWLSEPVSCVVLSTSLFCTNSKGFPILSQPHQHLLRRFLKINSQVLIAGDSRHERGFCVYRQYITWIRKNAVEQRTLYEQHSYGYEDQLQEPLQPLQDNLSCATYGVFEMDPYKYEAYEEAIYLALMQRSCSNKGDAKAKQVIYVLGAGQGPFVDASLQASSRSGCLVRIYVVEKNPNALLTLMHRLATEWTDYDVHLIPGDMRSLSLETAEEADIFVSELLGSFGDNELSPECLDGAQRLLKDDGICIPASYTSYVAPVQALRVHLTAARLQDAPRAQDRVQKHLETPFVSRLSNCQLLAPPKEAFTFIHPRKDIDNNPNSRYCSLTFTPQEDAVLHGFAGYFEAVLYGDVMLSIHPQRHSPNMFSWFPMFIPLVSAVPIKGGERITFHLWRCVSPRNVWYEWAITEPVTSIIHNAAGCAYTIGL